MLTLGFCWSFSVCPSLFFHLISLTPCLSFVSFYFSLSFPFTLCCVSFSLCLSPYVFLSSLYVSLFLPPLPPQPEISLSLTPSPGLPCIPPPGGEVGPGRVRCPPPSPNSGRWFSPLCLAWVPVISSAFGYEAQIAHQKG